MAELNLGGCMTIMEAAEHLGISRRGMYRVAARAEADGHVVRVRKFGHFLFLKSAFPIMRKYHLTHGKQTKEAMEFRRAHGRKGGCAKRDNAAKREAGEPVSTRATRAAERQAAKLAAMLDGLTVEQLAIANDLIKTVGTVEEASRAIKVIAALRRDASSDTAGKEA